MSQVMLSSGPTGTQTAGLETPDYPAQPAPQGQKKIESLPSYSRKSQRTYLAQVEGTLGCVWGRSRQQGWGGICHLNTAWRQQGCF